MQKRAKASSSRSAIRSLALRVIVTRPYTTSDFRTESFRPPSFGPKVSAAIPHFRDGVPCYYHRNGARAGPPERPDFASEVRKNAENEVTNSVRCGLAGAGKKRKRKGGRGVTSHPPRRVNPPQAGKPQSSLAGRRACPPEAGSQRTATTGLCGRQRRGT